MRWLLQGNRLFRALPGGNFNGTSFNNVGNNGNWWSATENDASNAWNRNMNNNNANVNRNNNNKTNGFSLRCTKDWKEGEEGDDPASLFLELHAAYLEARRHKRSKASVLHFEANLESELTSLSLDLHARTWTPRPSTCFINTVPVKREIIAADFRDRVVHHFLYNRIAPTLFRKFIHDSYACQPGKGTLFGIRRVEGFLRAASDDYRRDCWTLRLDIAGFFMAIHRPTLHDLVVQSLAVRSDLTDYLIHTTVFHDPLRDVVVRGFPQDWFGLPCDKSLMGSRLDCGLPIGNLTSQVYANVYLNPLDQFVKRTLGLRHYGRYVDDMVFLHLDREVLLAAIPRIRQFLSNHLGLTLHPRKIALQPASHGFPFLGVYILPHRTYIGRRTKGNVKRVMGEWCEYGKALERADVAWPVAARGAFRSVRDSYAGMLGHFACRRLWQSAMA